MIPTTYLLIYALVYLLLNIIFVVLKKLDKFDFFIGPFNQMLLLTWWPIILFLLCLGPAMGTLEKGYEKLVDWYETPWTKNKKEED